MPEKENDTHLRKKVQAVWGSTLKGLPLEYLSIKYCTNIRDLSPLKALPLKELHLAGCGLDNLAQLRKLPFKGTLATAGTSGTCLRSRACRSGR